MERSAAKCRVTEPSFSRPTDRQIEHPIRHIERDLVVVDLLHLVEDQRRMVRQYFTSKGGVAFQR